ncbi:hypothetical protein GPECTOR_1140g412 [Gonium pectorale]|uniref:BACK domain-containing protein n=1 Tax=Gonium pectorale TaxID=33097 RepID=A0A150FTP5_GONPE|nr:hypothetical protein GPECTOR_1140g412 [Gonium pectorale]|eukprot:KXZ40958.1 hypothetical protein GPECTOR_1140g412 [Gonium pectorale]
MSHVASGPSSMMARLLRALPSQQTDEEAALGDPLPGHTIVLRYASGRFRGQLNMINQQQEEGAAPDLLRGRPILRVLLGSAEELASARAAIKFAYTGEVQADSIREALGVLRQAAHLQVEGCAAACLERIKTLLPQAQGAAGNAPVVPPVLELYACERLWPEAVEEPRFASVLEAAKPLLVSHFGDTLAALNRPVLREQLLTLPAVALEALLESDDSGTDTEDSIMLLLATWMHENRGRTDSAARERLCRLVRLVQLSRQYATFVLPLLAADFACRRRKRVRCRRI